MYAGFFYKIVTNRIPRIFHIFNPQLIIPMKKILLALLLAGCTGAVLGQEKLLHAPVLNFADTYENTTDSQLLSIRNNNPFEVRIKEIRFYRTYSSPAFSAARQTLVLPAASADSIWIRFNPRHNIAHNSEMLVITEPEAYSFTVDLKGQGKYSRAYYATTENQSEEGLKAALKARLALGYVSLGYTPARDRMFMQIDNQKTNGQGASVNTIECIYTGRKAIDYTDRADAQTGDNFNTEHTFPQGYFNDNEPMRSDLHHLFPTDNPANNSRNNYAFGVATQPYKNDNVNTPSHLGANNLYEPRDEQKGRTARAMIYFVTRYTDYTNFFAPQENILRQWCTTFQPDSIERKRNNDVETYQKNRNPFIDYPQFLERITKVAGTSTAPNRYEVDYPDTIRMGEIISSDRIFTFGVPVVNNSNVPVTLSAMSLDDTILHFADNFPTDTLILPGESVSVAISCNLLVPVSYEIRGNLSFTINAASPAVVSVPVDGWIRRVLSSAHSTKNTFLRLYPNPVQDDVTIDHIKGDGVTMIRVADVSGRTVYTQSLPAGEHSFRLNTEAWPQGIYMVRITDGAESSVIRFVK